MVVDLDEDGGLQVVGHSCPKQLFSDSLLNTQQAELQ